MYVYSELNPLIFNRAYFQVNVCRLAALAHQSHYKGLYLGINIVGLTFLDSVSACYFSGNSLLSAVTRLRRAPSIQEIVVFSSSNPKQAEVALSSRSR